MPVFLAPSTGLDDEYRLSASVRDRFRAAPRE
jgi:hypothetical protein